MPPTVERNNAQRQPITTVLRNVIREYPAGGGVLRELCQNADDAGASSISFRLDTNHYSGSPLLHTDLGEYQGPALLAYNDSVFTDSDFQSLSQIGDSLKAQDPASTGKFGRGFNSVYNWTDGPSIISGTSLLLLDPHETWSATAEINCPGGPLYNFVKHHADPQIQNQLLPFGAFHSQLDREFHGTVIRMPLRTNSQAQWSKIVPGIPTTSEDIEEVFEHFSQELADTLLFLKNIRRITLQVDDKVFAQADAKHFTLKDSTPIEDSCVGDVNVPYRKTLVDGKEITWSKSFLCKINVQKGDNKELLEFAISHCMMHNSCMADDELKRWSRSFKLFPWAAIAAPLQVTPSQFNGRLFNILPLPIFTRQPFHMHGMFSITPDRASIHRGVDPALSARSEANMGAKWNKWLLDHCFVTAWVGALQMLKSLHDLDKYPSYDWNRWPTAIDVSESSTCCDTDLLQRVFATVIKDDLPLIPTVGSKFERHSQVLYAATSLNRLLLSTLSDLGIPISLPRYHKALSSVKSLSMLTPKAARYKLSTIEEKLYHNMKPKRRSALLAFIIADNDYTDLKTCHAPVLPDSSGSYQPFSKTGLKLNLTKQEEALFDRPIDYVIDVQKMDPATLQQLRGHIDTLQICTGISRWDLGSVSVYIRKELLTADADADSLSMLSTKGSRTWAELFWKWVTEYGATGSQVVAAFEGIPLIPIHGSRLAKVTSNRNNLPLDISSHDTIGSLFSKKIQKAPDLIKKRSFLFYTATELLTNATTDALRNFGVLLSSSTISDLAIWMSSPDNRSFVDLLDDDERTSLVGAINYLLPQYSRTEITSVLRMLPIYKAAFNPQDWIIIAPNRSFSYVGIDTSIFYEPFKHPGTIFIDLKPSEQSSLIHKLGCMNTPDLSSIFGLYILPSIEREIATGGAGFMSLFRFCLNRSWRMDSTTKQKLRRLACIPVSRGASSETTYLPASKIVDPESPIACLYDQDEGRFPNKDFSDSDMDCLRRLGILCTLTMEVIKDRVERYSTWEESELPSLVPKVKELLSMSTTTTINMEFAWALRWIPAQQYDGQLTLCSPNSCRDLALGRILHYVIPIARFYTHPNWRLLLGWNQTPSKNIRRAQLEECLQHKDKTSIIKLVEIGYLNDLISDISDQRWVLGKSEEFYRPRDLVVAGASGLRPYVDDIHEDFKFLKEKIGIKPLLSKEQLLEVQETLSKQSPLDDENLKVAVTLLEMFAKLGPAIFDAERSQIKAPDIDGNMRSIADLTTGNIETRDKHQFIMLSPHVPPHTARRLHIPSEQERFLEGITDSDDFCQEEDTETMIRDSLNRYPKDATFTEYLANAEDCGSATKISWILDMEENYPSKNIIDPELAGLQGPALFCHNDGVFSDNDLDAIRRVGVGSKGMDESKLGRFGRGALTMYHWTSTPSFVSGKYYVILDPQRKRLPSMIMSKRRRAGMRILLSDVRRNWPDQLRPFEGLCGFNDKTIDYHGTLWRFPSSQQNIKIAHKHLKIYLKEAEISLLFLKNINRIDVSQKNADRVEWEVTANRHKHSVRRKWTFPDTNEFITDIKIARHNKQTTSRWLVGHFVGDLKTIRETTSIVCPETLENIMSRRRLQVRCGVAACLTAPIPPEGRTFIDLPLSKSCTGLPVMITADMTLQSNRRDIPTDKSEDEDGALWNRWILSEVLARIYLMTIQGVMELKGHNGYKYWPQDPMDANKSIGEIVSKGFWDLCALFTMSMELHPKGNPYIHEPVPFSRLEGKGPIDTNIPPAKFELVDNGYGYLNLLPSDNDHRAVIGLLEALGHKNLIHPLEPALSGISRLQKRLKGTIDIPCVNPELVRSSLRTADAALAATSYLSTLTNESSTLCEVVNSLLVSFILSDNPTIDALSGCYILVLANATLAPIFSSTALSSIRPPSRRRFIIARPSDRGPWDLSYGLLEFRKDLLVHQNVAQRLWDTLKDSPCNVTVAQWDDIPWLFDQFHTLPPSDKQAMLHELWACLNRLPPEEISSFLAKTTIPLLAVRDPTVTGNQAYSYMRWKDFQTYENGVVLEQDSLPQNVISKTYVCYMQNFPGLQLVDQRTFPSFMGEQESFLSPQGAYRLLRAIEAVSLRLQSAFQYFQSNEHYENIANIFLSSDWSELSANHRPEFKRLLREIPIWRVNLNDNEIQWAVAEDLNQAPDSLMDWSDGVDRGLFLDKSRQLKYQGSLDFLGVPQPTVTNFIKNYTIVGHGKLLPASELGRYHKFLKQLIKHHRSIIADHPVVFGGNRKFCYPRELYHHMSETFVAAFRGSEDYLFLHPQLRGLNIPGLIIDVTPATALQCARSIQQRARTVMASSNGTQQLGNDALVAWNATMNMANTSRSPVSVTLAAMTSVRFIPAAVAAFKSHRRQRMLEILPGSRLTTLSEGITSSELPIAWSQLPVFLTDPIPAILEGQQRRLCTQTVVEHLMYISANRAQVRDQDVAGYIDDVRESYRYLEKHPLPSLAATAEIWLNIDTSGGTRHVSRDDFNESWKSASHLVLGLRYDTGSLSQVQSFLLPFRDMLEAAGVPTVKEAKRLSQPAADNHRSPLGQLDEFRKNGVLIDFEIRGQSATDVPIGAHRVVLAAGSSVFRSMMSAGMAEATSGQATFEFKNRSLEAVVEHIYTGNMAPVDDSDEAEVVSAELEYLLDLLRAADYFDMEGLRDNVEHELCAPKYIRPETVDHILQAATDHHAKGLKGACQQYIWDNQEIIAAAAAAAAEDD